MRYLHPKADLAFKRVFGEHPDLTMSFLNALLPLTPEQEIIEVEYLPLEMVPDNPLRKISIVDVRCTDRNGRQFIVEMQMIWSPEFSHRMCFNASKVYVRQIGVAKQYDELPLPVYSLNLANVIIKPDLEGYYHYYRMVHEENSDKIIEGLQLIFVELPKFTAQNYSEKKMQVLWLRYLTEIDEKTRQVPEELLANPEVKKAVTALEESAFSEAELLGYEKFWDIISVEKTLYNSAIRKGLAEGMEKGLAKGIEKGKAEEQRLIAANFKKQGIAFEIISQCTGLTLKDIETL